MITLSKGWKIMNDDKLVFVKITPEIARAIESLAEQITNRKEIIASLERHGEVVAQLAANGAVDIKYQVWSREGFQAIVDWWVSKVEKLR